MAKNLGNGKIKIESGDTLYSIYGSNWKQASGYTGDPKKLAVGTVLPAPGSGGGSSTKAKSTTSQSFAQQAMNKMDTIKNAKTTGSPTGQVSSANTSSYQQQQLQGSYQQQLEDSIANSIIELENKLNSIPGISFSQQELDTFTQKAIDQVKPYYDKKRSEIESGIKEGKIQSAEDLLIKIRAVDLDTTQLLERYDLSKARNEEELVNTLADITSSRDEDLAVKRDEWKYKLDQTKQNQVQSDVLTSGIGRKQISDLLNTQQMTEQQVVDRASRKATTAETTTGYNLKEIALARKQVEEDRVRRIGTPEQATATTTALRSELGLSPDDPLPSDAEIERLRAQRNQTVYKPTALTDLTEQQKQAEESRRQQLLLDEEQAKKRQYEGQRQSYGSQLAQKQREFYNVAGGSY